MFMDQDAWLGLLTGMIIGGLYAGWQLRALARHQRIQRERGEAPAITSLLPGSMTRMMVLLATLVIAQVVFPRANLKWVAIGIAVAYSVPFFWRLRSLMSQK